MAKVALESLSRLSEVKHFSGTNSTGVCSVRAAMMTDRPASFGVPAIFTEVAGPWGQKETTALMYHPQEYKVF